MDVTAFAGIYEQRESAKPTRITKDSYFMPFVRCILVAIFYDAPVRQPVRLKLPLAFLTNKTSPILPQGSMELL